MAATQTEPVVLGTNVAGFVDEKGILHLTIDTGNDTGPSKTGKTNGVATTHGNIVVAGTDGMKLGVNAYRTP